MRFWPILLTNFVSLDDILTFSKTKDEHIQHVTLVLEILSSEKLALSIQKYQFAQKEIAFLRTGKAKNLHPIGFESRKLTDTEQRYSAQEREMLAVCYALEHWRSIIEGTRIVVRTDHESLKYFRSTKIMTRRMAKFLDIVETFDPIIIYKPGAEQQAVDALSRMKIISPHEPDEVDHITTIDADTTRDTVERFHTELGHTSKTPIRRALTNEIQANPDIDWEQLLE